MPPSPTPKGKVSLWAIQFQASGQVETIRIANDEKLNTPPLSADISRPDVNNGRLTSSTANAMHARHSMPYRAQIGANKIRPTAQIETREPFCVVNATATAVAVTTRNRITNDRILGAKISASVGN